MNTEFTVLGGDERLLYMAEDLIEQGFNVHLLGFDKHKKACDISFNSDLSDALKKSRAVILPVPVSRDGVNLNAPLSNETVSLKLIADSLTPGCLVFCGMAGEFAEMLFKKGIRVYDYALRDEFAVRNAVPTAEGVCEILIHSLPITLRSSRIFITGYGRTAKACAKLFGSMGSRVTVAARRCSSLASASSEGYEALYIRELHRHIHRADVLINTVPAPIIDKKIIDGARSDCLFVEIASAPYGIDADYAQKRGIRTINAPSLPGRTSPKTAGIIIGDTVLNILREGNE
ncbi:MAG: dipicolinate synthase subunit DpsA [Clostridia bacterium]|nr:dipicolinate synthase subunit DpsA [Clostridia bacterium]